MRHRINCLWLGVEEARIKLLLNIFFNIIRRVLPTRCKSLAIFKAALDT